MRNSGNWTEARFTSFVKGVLRAGSSKWPPKWTVRKRAWRRRGVYFCAGFERKGHEVTATVAKSGGKEKGRTNNVFVDHITPIVGRAGFTSWDAFINGLYCEVDNLQVLCLKCHTAKTKKEKEERKSYGRK